MFWNKSIIIILVSLKQSFSMRQSRIVKDQNTRDYLAWTIGKGGSHARGVYPTRDTPHMGTGRSRHENHSNREVWNMKKIERDTEGKSPKQNLSSAKNQTIELPEGRESPYHRLD